MFFHSRSRSREFLGMIASDSHSRIVGMDFFHSLPVPEFWEGVSFIPYPFLNIFLLLQFWLFRWLAVRIDCLVGLIVFMVSESESKTF